MKKLLSLLLVLVMLLSSIPAFADATWTVSAEGALKVNSDVKLSGEVVIPDTVDGVTVTSLDGFAFNNQNDVTSIVMPDTIQSMSGSAINFLNGLTDVKLSENLQIIGDMNFSAMKGLTSLTIPASVCFIGDSMSSLSNLQTLTFEGVCPLFALSEPITGLNRSCVIYVPDDQVDAYKAALTNGYGTEEQVQPSGKNAVIYDKPAAESDFVFDAATGTITGYTGNSARLQIPAAIGGAAVKAIGEKAFSRNSTLCYVVIPEGVETIGNYAFERCDELVVVNFPTSLKKIGDGAFDGCYLSSVGWAEGLEEIGANAFFRYGAQSLTLPTTVKTIGEAAFKNGSIRKLYIGKNIESIGPEAFANNFLDRVELLTDRMIQIDETAFAGNTNETYVYLRWNVPYDVYKDYEHLFLNIYEGYTYLYIQAPIKDPSLGLEYPADGTDSYNQDVWVSYNGSQPNLMTWYSWNRIPITTLGDGLFKGNQTIRSWYPSHEFTMHHIGNEAFADSSVEIVDLYHEIYTIGEAAFRNCVNIKEITLPETLTSIAANAFEGCTGLEKITILCDPSVLPEGLLDSCTALTEVSAGPDATEEENLALQAAIFGKEIIILQQPADTTAIEGEMVSITVQLENSDGLSFEWYARNIKDKNFTLDESQTGDTYSVLADASSDGRMVYCVVSDSYGNSVESDLAMITVEAAPVVEPEPVVAEPETVVAPAAPAASVGGSAAGVWNAVSAEADGMTLDKAMLEMFGLLIKLTLNADGSGSLEMEGEAGEISWAEANGVVSITAEGETMEMTLNADGTMSGDFGGAIIVFEKESGAAPAVTETEVIEAPAAPAEGGVVGVWNAVSAEADGMTLDKAMLEMFGLLIKLTLNADGSGSLEMEGEAGEIAWTETDGVVSISVEGDSMEMTLNADGTMSGDFGGVIIAFEKEGGAAPAVTETETVETPAAPAEGGVVGVWNAVSAEADGMTLDKAMLEMFGMLIKLTLNADGSGSLEMEGEAGEIAWTETDGVVSISVEGDSMDMTLNADGTMSGDFGGAIIVFEKESGAAPAVTETEAVETPAASEGGFEGNWVNETGTLVLNADGTGSYTSNFSGNTTDKTWAAVDGGIEFSDMMWYGSKGVLQEDGTLNIDDGWHIFYREGSEPAAPADTDDGEEEMSDEEMLALLALLAEMEEEGDPAPFFGEWMGITAEAEGMTMNLADYGQSVKLTINEDGTALMDDGYEADETFWTMSGETMMVDEMIISLTDTGIMVEEEDMKMYFEPYTAEETPAVPAEGDNDMAAYAGIWYMCYCSTGGMEGDLRPMGVNSTLVLREDGYGSIDFPSPEEGEWYFDEGQARFGVNGMPMTLLDGGFLKFGSDLGGYVIFSQDAAADWEPAPSAPVAAPVVPVMPAATEAPKAAAPVAAADIDLQALMNRKFVAKNFTSYGQTMDASMLGAEYSLFFRENGTVDFGLAGMVVPNLTWGLGKVAIGLTEVDAFVINYYGTMFNAVLTETGFDMDYYGTMTLHFVPAE